MSSVGKLRAAVADVPRILARAGADRRRIGIIATAGLAAASCTIGFATLISGTRAAPELQPAPEPFTTAEPRRQDGIYSHRRLLQTGVAKSGAPVYRFVECRHLPKEERKLVQVGISEGGLAVLRVKPGDFCVFTQASMKEPAGAAAPKRVDAVATPATSALTSTQQYACEKFGPACRVALAIQRAENPTGQCEIYHYNTSDGTLDWGYFQINSVHLRRPGLNLRDLLDCKANVDYAYQVYLESGFAAWTTYTSGAYRRFLPRQGNEAPFTAVAQVLTVLRPAAPTGAPRP